MDKSTVDFGKELEHYLVQKFQELGYKNACRSNGSGNKGSLGDISGIDMVVEAKNRNTEDITIKKDVWDKLVASIPLHSDRLPMYVLRNKSKQTFCVMDAEDMFTILKELINRKNSSF